MSADAAELVKEMLGLQIRGLYKLLDQQEAFARRGRPYARKDARADAYKRAVLTRDRLAEALVALAKLKGEENVR